jgi:hypothetical protein
VILLEIVRLSLEWFPPLRSFLPLDRVLGLRDMVFPDPAGLVSAGF